MYKCLRESSIYYYNYNYNYYYCYYYYYHIVIKMLFLFFCSCVFFWCLRKKMKKRKKKRSRMENERRSRNTRTHTRTHIHTCTHKKKTYLHANLSLKRCSRKGELFLSRKFEMRTTVRRVSSFIVSHVQCCPIAGGRLSWRAFVSLRISPFNNFSLNLETRTFFSLFSLSLSLLHSQSSSANYFLSGTPRRRRHCTINDDATCMQKQSLNLSLFLFHGFVTTVVLDLFEDCFRSNKPKQRKNYVILIKIYDSRWTCLILIIRPALSLDSRFGLPHSDAYALLEQSKWGKMRKKIKRSKKGKEKKRGKKRESISFQSDELSSQTDLQTCSGTGIKLWRVSRSKTLVIPKRWEKPLTGKPAKSVL